MIYIGLDQSSKMVGYCIMDDNEILGQGFYQVPAGSELMQRVSYILDFLEGLIDQYDESYDNKIIVGLEDTQESRMNTNTFQLLTKVLGAMEYWLYSENIPYRVCHVSSWRSFAGVKGKRREDKKANAIRIVKEKFDIDAKEDAAEAILITYYLRAEHNNAARPL